MEPQPLPGLDIVFLSLGISVALPWLIGASLRKRVLVLVATVALLAAIGSVAF